MLEAQDHQDLPFEQVVEIVRPARSLAHAPLFQTTLNWLAGDTSLPDMDGLSLALVEQSTQTAKFDLSLNLGEHGDALVGTLDYATALFDAVTVRRYYGYFEQLLHALVNNEHVLIEQIPLVGEEERQYLLEHFNPTQQHYPQGQTVHALIEACAISTPDAIAAQVGSHSLSYAELNRQANALAHYLISLGVRPDDRVAVVARRGLETLTGSDERLAYLLSDSAPVVVLARQSVVERLPSLAVPVVTLDQPNWPLLAHNPQVPGLNAAHLAYVIYTSGSTGQPKGVMVEHRTLANLVHWHCEAFDLHAGSHTASVAGFGFDAMAWEIWPAAQLAQLPGIEESLVLAREGSGR